MTKEEIAEQFSSGWWPSGGRGDQTGTKVLRRDDKGGGAGGRICRKMFLAMAKDIRVIMIQAGGPAAQHAYPPV